MLVRRLGIADYASTWEAMKSFTGNRRTDTPDEVWVLQHEPVYTCGLNIKEEHFPVNSAIPLIRTDRGGQVTYHGPGQIVLYLLLDLKRLGLGVRELVRKMEQGVIELLSDYGMESCGKVEAPGVYVEDAKIAALGLKIRNGCCYHGISLNVDMDLGPFSLINPCGYKGLKVVQLKDFGVSDAVETVGDKLVHKLVPILTGKNT